MSEWFYARAGKQHGPVSFAVLVEIAVKGELDPLRDLVWTSTMKDWLPAGQVPGIFNAPSSVTVPAADPANPYATPGSSWTEVAPSISGAPLAEIVPGSEEINVTGCIKRGFELTSRNFGLILLVGIVYMAVTFAVSAVLGAIDAGLGWGYGETIYQSESGSTTWAFRKNGSPLNVIVSQVLSVFLSLGATRIGLNIVSGRDFSIGMLFGGGNKLLPAIGATILYGLMVCVGLLMLIVPGIYLAIRYGHYLTAMVDRNLGIMESFRYSSSLTTNNRMNLFLLGLLGILVSIAGCLALCVGLFFAVPVIWLAWIVAYRWLQYGYRAALDHPGTAMPMLRGM